MSCPCPFVMAVIPWEIPKVCKVGQWTVSTPHNKKIAHCILFNHVPARKKGFLLTLLFPVHVYENTWQVSILRSDKAAVTGRGHGHYKAKTGDRLIIEIFQVSCQLQGQTRLPIHFFSVSYCPFNLADLYLYLSIHLFIGLKSVRRLFSFQIFSEW